MLDGVRDVGTRTNHIQQKIEIAYSKFRLPYIHVSVELGEKGR